MMEERAPLTIRETYRERAAAYEDLASWDSNEAIRASLAKELGVDESTVPTTYCKRLGHPVLLNPDTEAYPERFDGGPDITANDWLYGQYQLVAYAPDENGYKIRHQTDGMVMYHPEMVGRLEPVRLASHPETGDPPNPKLPPGSGTPEEYEPRVAWERIEAQLPLTFEDVAPPNGEPQSQEGIRWIRVTAIEDCALHPPKRTRDTEWFSFAQLDRNDIHGRWQWAYDGMEQKIAVLYTNCD